MTRNKNPRNPGDIVPCACDGCENTFVLNIRAMHQLHCSKRCRDMAAKMLAAAREAMVPKSAKRLRMEAERLGGTVQGGAMVSGTLTLARREVIDVACIPQDRPELWT